ncbi:hypothetical protein GH733_001621 [Mirounga leonina]|nr:hypothetical protein GH733_001621 [Mirounga leonina]
MRGNEVGTHKSIQVSRDAQVLRPLLELMTQTQGESTESETGPEWECESERRCGNKAVEDFAISHLKLLPGQQEEQEAIMKVLQRDAALKRVEEERVRRQLEDNSPRSLSPPQLGFALPLCLQPQVLGPVITTHRGVLPHQEKSLPFDRHLPEKIKDDQQLKNMSGQWFYEAKAKRHRDRIHGADIIRASMRKKKLQVAAEQSKDRANEAKASWVNNVNKDAFLPPELTGAVDEPEDVAPASPSSVLVNQASTVMDTSQENTKKSAVSPAKQRKNPFNSSKLPEDHLSQQTKSEPSQNGKAGFSQTSKEGELSESKENSSIPDTSSQNLEKPKQTFPGSENGSPVKAPIPKARKILPKSHELKQEDNQSFPRQRTDSLSTRRAPRGILKRNSSSSSTDSETVRFHQNLEPKSKIVSPGLTIHERISEKEHSLEDDSSNSLESLKHVRFSAVKDELPQSPGLSRGWEVGEFSVLESDRLRNGTEDNVDVDEFWNDPKPSQYRKPLPLHQSASSPSASKNGTQQQVTSGSFPMNGHHSPLEVLTPRPESVENSSTTNEHKAKPSELSRLESELSKSPADGLSCVEPEPSQVPDHSSRDHQQGQCEYNQVTSKQVVLDENGHTAHLSSFYSSNKPKETRPQISGPSKNYPSVDQSGEVSPFQNKINEPIKRLPVAESWHYERDITLPAGQHPSNIGSGMHTPLEKDKSLISESNPNFKVKSLKERMDESNTEQVYNHSQFENLRKFWGLGANPNSQENVEKNTNTISQKYLVPFNSQKHKEFSDIKSSGKNTHEIGMLPGKKKILVREKIEKLNSKCTRQVLSDGTMFPLGPSRKSTHHLPGNESSKENVEKNTKWFVTPVFEEEKDYSDQEIQESIVKTSVLSKDYKDTFNDSLQKLLSEASLLAMPPSGGKVHGKQMSEPDISGNKRWPQDTDFAETEEDDKGHKETINEHVDKTVAPSKVKPNTLTASLDKLLKEAPVTSPCPLPIVLEPVTTRINSEPEEGRVYEKGIEWSRSTSAYQKEIIAPFPKGNETLVNTALPQKTESGECQLSMEDLRQVVAEGSHPSGQPSHLYRKDSFGDVANSPQEMPSSRDAHLAPQDKALPLRREISETVEKVILPPKTASNDVNAILQKLLREACYPVGREVVPGEVQAEFPEGVQAAGSPQNSTPWATMDITVPDRNDFYSFKVVPDKTHNVGSYLAARIPPSEQTCRSCGSTVSQRGKELPQEMAEIVRETVTQPKSEFLEFSAGLEKLLKEVIETPSSKYESDPGTLSPSKLTGRAEVSRQAASEFQSEEIKETVKKSETPLITESTFDISFEKLFREAPEAPSYQLQVSVKEEKPEKEPSQSKQASFLRTVPHFDWTASEASEMKLMSNVFKSQVNQCDEVLGGDKAVTDLSVDLCGSESGLEILGTLQFYVEHKIGITETIKPAEDRDSESEVAGVQEGASQEPGLEEAPKAISMSRNRQPIPLLTNTENATETSNVELILASPCKRTEKKEEKDFSDSDFSGGDKSSNAESWRKTSSSEEEPSPVLKTLERSAARKMPSKSLEDISSDSPNQAKVDNLPEELVRSAEDDQKADQEPDTNECIPGMPSQPDNPFSHPDKLKRMSKSVPAFLQDEASLSSSDDRETDTTSESSYQLSRHKKSPSSLTNLSSSSGMTSLSSVSGSVMSVYSGDFGNLEVKGNIQFAIDYVDSLKELHVFVAQCKDLAAADVKKQRSDPYVKTYLLPDKGKMGKKKTLVVKKTLNPVYNEILRYKIEKQILKTQKLNLSVWHRDTFKRNSFLGEVELDLETWDWDNKQNKQLKWYPLKRKTAPVALEAENRGEMKLALQYVPEPIPGKKLPTTGEVHIWVKECLDLPQLRGSHLNSFVKCIILPDTSRKSRQKTRAVGKTTSPVFNHTMVYDGFRPEDLTEACVELTVWDHYKLTNQFLGGLRIGFGTGKSYGTEVDWMDSTSEEVALWEKMVKSPNTWIEATLPLRMLLIAKISK